MLPSYPIQCAHCRTIKTPTLEVDGWFFCAGCEDTPTPTYARDQIRQRFVRYQDDDHTSLVPEPATAPLRPSSPPSTYRDRFGVEQPWDDAYKYGRPRR